MPMAWALDQVATYLSSLSTKAMDNLKPLANDNLEGLLYGKCRRPLEIWHICAFTPFTNLPLNVV